MHVLPLLLFSAAPAIEMYRLPSGEAVSTRLSESYLAQQGTPAAVQAGVLSRAEARGLPEAMAAAYEELAVERGSFPTPVLRDQSAAAFDLVVIAPEKDSSPDRAAIFLHGYGGAWTLECWLFARRAGVLTVCPSTGVEGRWSTSEGEKILAATQAWLAKKSRTRLVLAGLSNGGAGACQLARAHEKDFTAAIAISGVAPPGPRKLPMLVLHGRRDTMASFENARAFANAQPERTLFAADANHLLLLHQRDELGEKIAAFIAAH